MSRSAKVFLAKGTTSPGRVASHSKPLVVPKHSLSYVHNSRAFAEPAKGKCIYCHCCGVTFLLFPLLILWITHLEYKDLLVTSSSCWYVLILMGKVFLYCEKVPPDLLHWRRLILLTLILPLCFLYWTFYKRHKEQLLCLHLVLHKDVKIQWPLDHLILKVP